MAATLAHAVWFLCVYLLGNVKPVDSIAPNFTGGIIRWRPVNPAAFDGRVRIIIIGLYSSHDAIFIVCMM